MAFDLGMAPEQRLEMALEGFRIRGKVQRATRGPLLDVYDVSVPAGTRLSRLRAIADDVARATRTRGCRVDQDSATGVVRFELARSDPQPVRLADVLAAAEFDGEEMALPVGLGADAAGAAVVADLAVAPHLLVAGTTGSGKSVLINAILLSLMRLRSPAECRLLLADPKVLELSRYDGAPHLLAPVLTAPDDVAQALRLLIGEMEGRNSRLARAGARDLREYNAGAREPLPRIVLVVDEVADLVATAAAQFEDAICRLASTARSAGIHLVLATQRPSVDVMRGVMKANLPSRVCMRVASRVDSRVVIDQAGGEALQGRGDMLYLSPDSSRPRRVHGAMVTAADVDEEVAKLKGGTR